MEKYINLSQTLKYSQRKDYSDFTYLFSPSNLKMNNISSYYGKNYQTKQTSNSNNNKLKYVNLNQNIIQNSLKRTESNSLNNNLNFNLLSPNHNKILKELKNYLDSYKSNNIKNSSNNFLTKNMKKISSKKNLNISNNTKINSKIINLSNSALNTKLRKKTNSPKNKIKNKTNNLKKNSNENNSIRVNNKKEHYSSLRKNNRTNNIYNNKSSLYMSGDENSLKNNTTANTTNNFIIRKNSTNVNNNNLSNNLNENEIFINIKDLLNYNNNNNKINFSDLFLEFYNFNKFIKENNLNKFSIVDSVIINSYLNTKNDELKFIYNLNVEKPENFNGNFPNNFSYFGIFDGHCGKECSEFLQKNLLNLIINNKYFPNQIEKSLEIAIEKIEEKFFLECFYNEKIIINSGSCVLICLIIDEFIYTANLGNSKLIISYNNCEFHKILTENHTLENENEKIRVEKNGGKIYNEKINLNKYISNYINNNNIFLIGPLRFFPGNLKITRTIGDFKYKINSKCEKINIISSKPSIKKHKLKSNIDFICLGNEGIFNFIKEEDVLKMFKILIKNSENKFNLCDFVLKFALKNKSVFDMCCIIIFLNKKKLNKIENSIKMFSNNFFKKKFKKKFHRKGSLDVDNYINENESKFNNLNNKEIFVETEPYYYEDDFELNKIIDEKQITSSSNSKNKHEKINSKKDNHSTLELKKRKK
jgi:serine/threonine protein phosphatase PrpC